MSAAPRTPLDVFEQIYLRQRDPWGYETSLYERAKYQRSLAALGTRRYARALEVGCSIGVFTAELAGRCDTLLALEPSPTALARARQRLGAHPHVELLQAAVPEGLPAGPFDLVVCSEVLCYLSEPLLVQTLRGIESRLGPRGTLIAVHFRRPSRLRALAGLLGGAHRRRSHPSPAAPLSGDAVHALLRSHTRLLLTHEERHDKYQLDRFEHQA